MFLDIDFTEKLVFDKPEYVILTIWIEKNLVFFLGLPSMTSLIDDSEDGGEDDSLSIPFESDGPQKKFH